MFLELISILLYLTVFIVFLVAYVNGWTDAPNSIAACVATKVLPMKKAVKIAALADFAGSLTVGILSGRVSERIIELTVFEGDKELYIFSVFSAMLSVVIWAVSAWYFGIPTSESHGMLAGIFGSSIVINHGIKNIKIEEWINTAYGLLLSIIFGYFMGLILSKLVDKYLNFESSKMFEKIQILSGIITAFLHGAQDSQKFVGIIISVILSMELKADIKKIYIIVTIVCALFISLGTSMGGERIIRAVGNDMVKLNIKQGFSADVSGLLCLLVSTLCGIPVSTTHVKTVSIIGAGTVNGNINWNTVRKMIAAWILTFPACFLISYIITYLIIK